MILSILISFIVFCIHFFVVNSVIFIQALNLIFLKVLSLKVSQSKRLSIQSNPLGNGVPVFQELDNVWQVFKIRLDRDVVYPWYHARVEPLSQSAIN